MKATSCFFFSLGDRGQDFLQKRTQLEVWIVGKRTLPPRLLGLAISIDLNRESILTDTNDVTLTLKTIRIEFFPIFLWFFEISNQLSSFHSTFVSFNVVLCYRHSLSTQN